MHKTNTDVLNVCHKFTEQRCVCVQYQADIFWANTFVCVWLLRFCVTVYCTAALCVSVLNKGTCIVGQVEQVEWSIETTQHKTHTSQRSSSPRQASMMGRFCPLNRQDNYWWERDGEREVKKERDGEHELNMKTQVTCNCTRAFTSKKRGCRCVWRAWLHNKFTPFW